MHLVYLNPKHPRVQKRETILASHRAISQGWFLVYTHPGSMQMMFSNYLNGHVLSFLTSLLSMCDLNSLTRDQTLAPALERVILTTGLPGKSLIVVLVRLLSRV